MAILLNQGFFGKNGLCFCGTKMNSDFVADSLHCWCESTE